MPYLKGNNAEAASIHEEYQTGNDQRAFLKAARTFLEREKEQPSTIPNNANVSTTTSTSPNSTDPSTSNFADATFRPDPPGLIRQQQPATPQRPQPRQEPTSSERHEPTSSGSTNQNGMPSVEQGLGALLLRESDPIISMPFPSKSSGASVWGSAAPSPITPPRLGLNSKVTSSPWGDSNSTPQPQSVLQQQQLLETVTPVASPARATPASTKREVPQPKRVWTHFEEQPGRILVHGVSGEDHSIILSFGPRDELTAHWSLPIDYLRQHRSGIDPNNASLDRALQGLTVGLFRRGCTENGQQASIISKEISGYDYWHDPGSNCIRGKVPFFSPRTPGNVLFRMYWETDPLHTLAMGPTLRVRVLEQDFESSVRFILSNFKGRKSNPTSLSSLHSLATVLETPLTRRHESMAARSVWGCVQEARKVIEACYQEYIKTSSKMAQLEEKVEELKKQVEGEETKSQELSIGNGEIFADNPGDSEKSEAENALHEKTRALLGGRASCERKWRDSQLAFAGILKAVLTNPSMGSLLRRDLITRMRVEYELWCPLSEEFAVPSENAETWYECIDEVPQSITADHFHAFQQARVKMQMRTLGFDVNTMTLEDVLFPRNRTNPNQRAMDPGAVCVFNSMSAAMGQYYQDLFIDEDRVVSKRELIRQRTERYVQECGAFPPGTEVVIFGSSANGFGSPKSDLDMCLHLPTGANLSDDDRTGSEAMAKLAEHFERSGMKGVDTARLTARIPIIMYKCPDPLSSGDADEDLLECDLSMHNPLAVLNTSFLRSYAEITPVTRVLAGIVKRWAKARDINSPARHTLSSYGYIIMLLHFLTYHKRTGNGLVSPVAQPEGDPQVRNQTTIQATPLLPNLQWLDQAWPNMPKGTPYRELSSLPQTMMKHPMKDNKVNTFFYKPNTPHDKQVLQNLFPGQDLSLAILLASFFRYFAYEFDYKRHVVSLHSTAARGVVEREVKAELDGWRNYSAALAIEDPFELDYDIAHVLRGGYYHRIRREFALAYTKIADAASGRPNSWNKGDLRGMSGRDLIDWICEPISTEREQL
jgi:DNA polymerase sigma